jgi:hypothetical protein
MAEVTEDFCGLRQTVSERETHSGTKYRIARWTCPNCGKACSCIYVDDEWCHGDSLAISFGPETDADGIKTSHHKCGACWATDRVQSQPTLAGIEAVDEADNRWFGDMLILQVLADSEHVNDQEREVLTRWMAGSAVPSGAPETQNVSPKGGK